LFSKFPFEKSKSYPTILLWYSFFLICFSTSAAALKLFDSFSRSIIA
jgi:hypothetical protein